MSAWGGRNAGYSRGTLAGSLCARALREEESRRELPFGDAPDIALRAAHGADFCLVAVTCGHLRDEVGCDAELWEGENNEFCRV